MTKSIKLKRTRYGYKAGAVLVAGKDIPMGTAETLVRIGNAVWVETKPAKPKTKNKALDPAKEVK